MIWHLIAVVIAGFGAAGIAAYLRLLTKRKLPKWIIPVFAGSGMLAYQIYYEYTWFEHKQSLLPNGAEVVELEKGHSLWRPWTYLFPLNERFTVVDKANLMQNSQDGQLIAQFILYRFERGHIDQIHPQAYVVNCDTREQIAVDQQGTPQNVKVRQLPADSPLLKSVCQ